MQLALLRHHTGARWGIVLGDEIALLDLSGTASGAGLVEFPRRELDVLAARARGYGTRVAVADADLLPPIPAPSKIIAIGLNYADHIAESGLEVPEVPPVFAKFPSSITGPRDVIHRPRVSTALDYEGELGIVIGTRCRHVPRERVNDVIAGYVVVNDVSVRDWQIQSPQWSLAKSFDTHTPIGPWLTLADSIDGSDLAIETRINGELRQSSSTRHLAYDAADLIVYLSQACTLNPGDIIATGTPAGVGALMDPPVYLVPGDEVRVAIEGLGELVNTVVDEPEETARIGAEQLPLDQHVA